MKTVTRKILIFSLLLLSCIFFLSHASASIVNGSFEIANAGVTLPELNQSRNLTSTMSVNEYDDILGWTITAGSIDWVGRSFWNSSQGDYSIDMTGSSQGKISQSFATIVGTRYIVSFDLSGNPYAVNGTNLSLGAYVYNASDVAIYSNTYTFTDNITTTLPGFTGLVWNPYSFEFIATSSATTLFFQSLSTNPINYGPVLDNVRVEVVPIPPAILLLGSGMAGLVALRRKFQR